MNTWEQLGIGGLVIVGATYMLTKLLPILAKAIKNGNGNGPSIVAPNAGGQTPEYWEMKIREIVNESLAGYLKPALEGQTKVLEKISDGQQEMSNNIRDLVVILKYGNKSARHST